MKTNRVNILLVDDEPANLLALEAVLGVLGETLVRAGSGEEALKKVLVTDFAAILLDIRMPVMDGLETARLIRSRLRSRTTPIIFVTASGSLFAEEAYALGAVDFLTKPLVPAIIKAKVAFFVELHRSKEELRAAKQRAVERTVELANQQAFLMAVLEAVEDGIVACDQDGSLTVFNRATREFHGRLEEPLSADKWASHYDLYRADNKTPLPKNEIPLYRALAGERVRDAEMVIAPQGGKPRTLLASGRPLFDEDGRKLGAVVSMHDITVLREAEAAREAAVREQVRRQEAEAAAEIIRASEERMRLATEAGGLGVWLWDASVGNITWENDRLFEMFGVPLSDQPMSTARFLAEFIHPDDVAAFQCAMVETFESGNQFHFQGRFYRQPDHEQRWLEFTGRLQPAESGAPLQVLGTVADITDRKGVEDDLRRLASDLSETDRRKTEFLAILAHELRNPLAPLRNGLEIMRLAVDNPVAVAQARDMMERQVAHLHHLVNDLLDVARITRGKLQLKKKRVELKDIVASAVETSLSLIEAGRHSLMIQVPEEPFPLDVDLIRIAQVVSNLLSNAAKYTSPGGRIELLARRDGGEVLISVSDTGIGISPAALPTVFDMFTQVGSHIDKAQGGLGIGLTLVRRLVELHGGVVTASSAGVGRGSTFMVRLPLAEIDESQAISRVRDAHAISESDAKKLRVLVADDNKDAVDSLSTLLEMGGHITRVANDGNQALQVAQEFRPEVVFLDIGMPGMNGYEVARTLRRTQGMERVMLVALTGWGAEEDRIRSREAGFDQHLTKPAELTHVNALLSARSRYLANDLSHRPL